MADAAPSIIRGNRHYEDDVSFGGNVALPDAAVDNDAIDPAAGIAASKLQHLHRANFSQPNTAATSETRHVFTCHGATGTVIGFKAGSIVAALLGATVTVDLKKNGASVLSSVITLDNANTARASENGTLNGAQVALVAGDELEVVTVATVGGGTLPTGVFASANIVESYV